MAKVERIRDFKVKSGDCFFFDNNVWMFLFSPISGAKEYQQRVYSNLLRNIQTARATIFINSLIVSEYINRSLRLNHSIWQDRERRSGNRFVDYKHDYRGTEDFDNAQEEAYNEMSDILSIAERKPDDFNALKLDEVMKAKGMDFNDAYYAYFCKLNRLILVTDDKDLQSSPLDITILTA
ncbi:MAG: PIN domain-containing protein [Muribaculaceae bacterium]|nr:PIN domain-containing protein [Muribaculaceae bacterium]